VSKLDEMWAALEMHKPEPSYADAWQQMLDKRTTDVISTARDAAYKAADAGLVDEWAAMAADAAYTAVGYLNYYAQRAIDAIKEERL